MISINTHKNKVMPFYDIRLKSTDQKPTDKVPNGSSCIEVDTGKKYLFDGDSKQWTEISSSVIATATGVEF